MDLMESSPSEFSYILKWLKSFLILKKDELYKFGLIQKIKDRVEFFEKKIYFLSKLKRLKQKSEILEEELEKHQIIKENRFSFGYALKFIDETKEKPQNDFQQQFIKKQEELEQYKYSLNKMDFTQETLEMQEKNLLYETHMLAEEIEDKNKGLLEDGMGTEMMIET